MSPAEKVFQMLDALLPDPQAMRFVDSTRAPAACPTIGMPSLRVFKPTPCDTSTYHRSQVPRPLATVHEQGVAGQAPDCHQALQWYRRAAEHAFDSGEKCYGY